MNNRSSSMLVEVESLQKFFLYFLKNKESFKKDTLKLKISPLERRDALGFKDGMVNGINLDDIADLIEALAAIKEQCYPNVWIDLSGNQIGFDGGKLFIEAIKKGDLPQKIMLDFRCCSLGPQFAVDLADALTSENRTTDVFLDLQGNGITDVGAYAIAKALTHNNCSPNLRLALGFNHLSIEGIKQIAMAVSRNNSISAIYVDCQPEFFASEKEEEYLYQIKFHCIKNNLLKKYNEYKPDSPQSFYLQKLCKELGVTLPFYASSAVPPLRFSCASFFADNKERIETYEEVCFSIKEKDPSLEQIIRELEKLREDVGEANAFTRHLNSQKPSEQSKEKPSSACLTM